MIRFKLEELVYPKRLPWDKILNDLKDAGVTPSETAELIGSGWSSLQTWRKGVEPRYSVGVSILTIHTRYCGEELTNQRKTE